MSVMSTTQIARALGGNVSGRHVLAPGPGHSPKDRSLQVTPDQAAPRGLLIHSYANDDPLVCKDYACDKLGMPPWTPKASGARCIAEYIYHDQEKPYLKVRRLELADGSKSYPQSHWHCQQWVAGKPKGPKIPYRLPELLDSDRTEPVYIVEGEKCADAVRGLGLCATTASEGAGKWTADLNEHFPGRIVRIIPDNDEPGRRHAIQVFENLSAVAESVAIVELPGLATGEDVYDWIYRYGGTAEALGDLQASKPADATAPKPSAQPDVGWREHTITGRMSLHV
jgi:hypothetical protein